MLWSRNSIYSAAFIFGSLTVLQAYLKQQGISDTSIGLLNTLINVTQVLVMLLYLGRVDSCKKPIKLITFSILGQLTLPFCIIFLCLFKVDSIVLILCIAFSAVLIQNVFAGLRLGMESKIYVYMSTPQTLGRVLGIDGIIAGIISVISGFLLAPILSKFIFPMNIAVAFGICAILMLFSVIITNKLVLFDYTPREATNVWVSIKEVVKMPQYKKLFITNVTRGISQAAAFFLLPVGIFRLSLGMKHTSLIVSCTVWAVIISSLFFTLLVKKLKSNKLVFAAALIGSIGFVMMVTVNSIALYIAACFLVMLSQSTTDRAISLGNYEIVPRELTGAFSTVRISITFLTNAIASIVIGWSIGKVSLELVFFIIAAVFLLGGIIFLFEQQKLKLENNN